MHRVVARARAKKEHGALVANRFNKYRWEIDHALYCKLRRSEG
jgi:hypothetical protein